MGRLLAIPVALLVLLAGAMVWSRGEKRERADLTFINRGDIRTLDPNRMSWAEDIRVGYALYEGLYALDPVTLEAIPGTAGLIDISEDETIYTFYIRPEAKWSNGDDVVVDDFIFAWRRMLELPGDYTYLLDYIKGAVEYRTAFAEKKPADFNTVEMKRIDAKTLRVTLNHPVTFFPDLCAFPPYFPLNERTMRKFAVKDPSDSRRTIYEKEFIQPPHLVTNGPYRLDTWEFKKRIRMVASDHYWDRKNVRSRVIEQVVVEENKLGEFLRYEQGKVDWLAEAPAEQVASLLEQARKDPSKKRNDLHVFPAFGTYFYSINCQDKLKGGRDNPFKDVRVRKALAMTIKKQPIVETVTRSGEVPALHYVPQNTFKDYPVPKGQEYDPAQARKLLAEAGYPGGKGFPPAKLTFNTGSVHGDIAQVVRRQWQEELGLDIELEPVEPTTFSDRLHNKEYEVARASWYGDYNDVSTFTDKYLANSDNNDSGWVNKEYDDLLAKAAREGDAKKRLAMLSRAEEILLDEVPIIPVYYYVNKYMFRPNVKGIALNSRNMAMFKAIYVER